MKGLEGYVTTGQIAKRTGITVRTLRYYDQIGLLTPAKYDPAYGRLYSNDDLIRLQHIQTLKYIGLSLQEIQSVVEDERQPGQSFRSSLMAQRDAIRHKIAKLENVHTAIHRTIDSIDAGQQHADWTVLADLIQAVHEEQSWLEQYQTAARLRTRIDLYDRFSVNPIGWHRWVFDHLLSLPGSAVLELGGGDGALWTRNLERVPADWKVSFTDLSRGMVAEARSRIGHDRRFTFLTADAQDIPFHDAAFDIVIANNVLYHVRNIPGALAEIRRVLKPGGTFCTSTMSMRHLREVELIAAGFDPAVQVLDRVIERFHLDHAPDQLAPYFRQAEVHRYDDELQVTEAQPLIDYILSTPMNARELLSGERLTDFTRYIKARLQQEGKLIITKDNGIVMGRNL
ncbi:methyltransferase domain-containing protein [Paenibacillus chartarius]|uniref:Methyltransferase domain-containing protein n=1 Tax=Paenibacillus chartarius TaxID=747481 RepID=A0ABV6DHD4_9BACL